MNAQWIRTRWLGIALLVGLMLAAVPAAAAGPWPAEPLQPDVGYVYNLHVVDTEGRESLGQLTITADDEGMGIWRLLFEGTLQDDAFSFVLKLPLEELDDIFMTPAEGMFAMPDHSFELVTAAPLTAVDSWLGGALRPGDRFVYEFTVGLDGEDGSGHLTITVQEGNEGLWEMVFSGRLLEEIVDFRVDGAAEDLDGLYYAAASHMYGLPEPVYEALFRAFWFPWHQIPFAGVPLGLGWSQSHHFPEDVGSISVIRSTCTGQTYSGLLGQVFVRDYGDQFFMDVCVDLEIPLPVSIRSSGYDGAAYGEGSVVRATLVSYADDAEPVPLPFEIYGFDYVPGTLAVGLQWDGPYDLDLELWREDMTYCCSAYDLASPDIVDGDKGAEWIVFAEHDMIDLSTGRWIVSPYFYGPESAVPVEAVVTVFFPDGTSERFYGMVEYGHPGNQWFVLVLDVDALLVEELNTYFD